MIKNSALTIVVMPTITNSIKTVKTWSGTSITGCGKIIASLIVFRWKKGRPELPRHVYWIRDLILNISPTYILPKKGRLIILYMTWAISRWIMISIWLSKENEDGRPKYEVRSTTYEVLSSMSLEIPLINKKLLPVLAAEL